MVERFDEVKYVNDGLVFVPDNLVVTVLKLVLRRGHGRSAGCIIDRDHADRHLKTFLCDTRFQKD